MNEGCALRCVRGQAVNVKRADCAQIHMYVAALRVLNTVPCRLATGVHENRYLCMELRLTSEAGQRRALGAAAKVTAAAPRHPPQSHACSASQPYFPEYFRPAA